MVLPQSKFTIAYKHTSIVAMVMAQLEEKP